MILKTIRHSRFFLLCNSESYRVNELDSERLYVISRNLAHGSYIVSKDSMKLWEKKKI